MKNLAKKKELVLGQNSVLPKDLLDAFKTPDWDIPNEDAELLEKAFVNGEVVTGGTIELPNGHKYQCMAVGWRLIKDV